MIPLLIEIARERLAARRADIARVEAGPDALRRAADPVADQVTRIRLGLATHASGRLLARLRPRRLP